MVSIHTNLLMKINEIDVYEKLVRWKIKKEHDPVQLVAGIAEIAEGRGKVTRAREVWATFSH